MSKEWQDDVGDQLIDHGYAIVKDVNKLLPQVRTLFSNCDDFFGRIEKEKLLASTPRLLEGYLPLGSEYSQSPDRPDLCESFAVWHRNRNVPEVREWASDVEIHQLLTNLLPAYKNFADEIFDAIRRKISPGGEPLRAADVSYLQLNHYRPADFERDLLQDPHEDGHLLTILRPSAPGAEILQSGEYCRVTIEDDEFLLMPGSLLTLITGGLIPPLFHRVRNDRSTAIRKSLMYFINPSLDEHIDPWVKSHINENVCIRETAIKNSASFGLRGIDETAPSN